MSVKAWLGAVIALAFLLGTGSARAEILAMMNYESKSPDSLKSMKLTGPTERVEGIAVIDVDPKSANFGKILMDIPMSPDQVVHHIFYDRTMSKAYITSLASPSLQVMDMTRFPYRITTLPIEGCSMAEDVIFDEANERWFLTCMNSSNVFVGSVKSDELITVIDLPGTYPHGLAVNSKANRILVTSTVSGDMKVHDEVVSVVDASSYEPLGAIRLSEKPEGSGEAPVEILFVPGAETPIAYVTNMFGNTLWTLTWDEASQSFSEKQVYDFNELGVGVPLEMYFNEAVDRLYVTTGSPGHLHVFDLAAGPGSPSLITSIETGKGAHHVAITQDEKLAFVQNALLDLPGLNEGSVTVVDLEKQEAVAEMDTLKLMGMNPNSIVLLPQWNHFAGH